jgi:PEGA domain
VEKEMQFHSLADFHGSTGSSHTIHGNLNSDSLFAHRPFHRDRRRGEFASAFSDEEYNANIAGFGGPSADGVNRKALEQRAGANGGKLLLRSMPHGAQVFVDGAFVGRTPRLLIVGSGKYKIRMRGQREEFGERTVALAAKETQEITLVLVARYPEHVLVR